VFDRIAFSNAWRNLICINRARNFAGSLALVFLHKSGKIRPRRICSNRRPCGAEQRKKKKPDGAGLF
jgi:hypothetical protein